VIKVLALALRLILESSTTPLGCAKFHCPDESSYEVAESPTLRVSCQGTPWSKACRVVLQTCLNLEAEPLWIPSERFEGVGYCDVGAYSTHAR
jgi:hypothetical protein